MASTNQEDEARRLKQIKQLYETPLESESEREELHIDADEDDLDD
jgi:hypothetical protein